MTSSPDDRSQDTWTAVDRYITDLLVPPDAVLEATLASSEAAGLPPIQISATQGKFLQLMARMQCAKSILEIGTLGGYSTIWLARALSKGGKLTTLELDPTHARVASVNIALAGLADIVDIRVGPAIETLPKLLAENQGPFDFVFIDADKPSNAEYFQWAMRLTRPGSVIIVDNVVRHGDVIDATNDDPRVIGTRKFNEVLASETRVSATTIQTVGIKGYDGFAIAVVN